MDGGRGKEVELEKMNMYFPIDAETIGTGYGEWSRAYSLIILPFLHLLPTYDIAMVYVRWVGKDGIPWRVLDGSVG